MLNHGGRKIVVHYIIFCFFVCIYVKTKFIEKEAGGREKGSYPKMIVDIVRVENFSMEGLKKKKNLSNALVHASILVRYEK